MIELTQEKLDDLRRLSEAATNGPWVVCEDEDEVVIILDDDDNNWPYMYSLIARDFHQGLDEGLSDAMLIAEMRDALPALLDAAEERNALAASVDSLQKLFASSERDLLRSEAECSKIAAEADKWQRAALTLETERDRLLDILNRVKMFAERMWLDGRHIEAAELTALLKTHFNV